MAIIARLAGEGIGPFKSFDFDFSDADGNPHPGPHIFAGINGSGKSTILRTIAWLFEFADSHGFQWQEWEHLVQGYKSTRAMLLLIMPGIGPIALAKTTDATEGWAERLHEWLKASLVAHKVESLSGQPIQRQWVWPRRGKDNKSREDDDRLPFGYLRVGGPEEGWPSRLLIAAYGPSRLLKYLPEVNLSVRLKSHMQDALSFQATVQNEAIQSWLLGLFSKKAIAKERGQSESKYSTALGRFEHALKLMCDQDIRFSVDIEPSLQPRLLMYHKNLDFSQLPDGVRSTVGWLADFLMRMDMLGSQPESTHSGVLLLDEVDAHLHPKWQRSILPSINKALPEVQVFATSHSPFVIASCPGARIHVLELDDDGRAYNRPPEDAPIGESLLATMKDIFGVSSRFDIDTEKLLEEWNGLKRDEVAGALSSKQESRMQELQEKLSSRSEELRQIVTPMLAISDSLIASLQSGVEPVQRGAKTKVRKQAR